MPPDLHKRVVVFSVTNCICHDQRVRKMAHIIESLGQEVIIAGRYRGDCCDTSSIPFRTKRFRMVFRKGFLFYKFFNIRLFLFLLFKKADLLVANDLDTLLPNYLVSVIKKIPVVLDSHEYFTGVPELQGRPLVRWIWKSIERAIFPRIKYHLTVSDSIADQFNAEYGLRPLTVRNCSPGSESIMQYTRQELGIDANKLLLILQGTGINRDRGGEELIEALKETDNVFLLIIGSGDLIPQLKGMVQKYGLGRIVRFIPPISWAEMMRYTKSADAGLSLDKSTNPNHRFSLPNKIFDYISAGIPVIAGDLPEVTGIISDYESGIIIPEITQGEVLKAIRLLDTNRDLLERLKTNAGKAAGKLRWETESEKVKGFYINILNSHGKN